MMRGILCAFATILGLSSVANAQVTLQNDGFTSGMAAGFQAGFVSGEMGASRFVAASGVQQLLRVQFLFGDAAVTRTVTLRVYDDPSGNSPGAELFSGDYDVTGSASALQEIDLTADSVQVPAQFRVALEFHASGLPCIARDADGNINASRNYIFAQGLGWVQSQTLGLQGDWIIRAIVSTAGGTPDAALPVIDANPNQPDADPTQPDGAPPAGDCLGNPDCPSGQYCDTNTMTCTFDCREDTDCPADGVCNSLGQCLEGGGGGGGCCRTDDGGNGAAGALFGFGVLVLVVRRRRR